MFSCTHCLLADLLFYNHSWLTCVVMFTCVNETKHSLCQTSASEMLNNHKNMCNFVSVQSSSHNCMFPVMWSEFFFSSNHILLQYSYCFTVFLMLQPSSSKSPCCFLWPMQPTQFLMSCCDQVHTGLRRERPGLDSRKSSASKKRYY